MFSFYFVCNLFSLMFLWGVVSAMTPPPPGENPGYAGQAASLSWPGNTSGFPGGGGGSGRGEDSLGTFASTAAPRDPAPDEQMSNGWNPFL